MTNFSSSSPASHSSTSSLVPLLSFSVLLKQQPLMHVALLEKGNMPSWLLIWEADKEAIKTKRI
ncbi:rCG28782, isoform CRA_a [Rattus norvegicus]|uniref:RCG28782, isoform CRA_a n=1 Tax=Rattus norvegicus TaxID=10116 RepID=A6HV74_RAT|nr:rCG28782, isoform CRA_a [Rattus norvegicus]